MIAENGSQGGNQESDADKILEGADELRKISLMDHRELKKITGNIDSPDPGTRAGAIHSVKTLIIHNLNEDLALNLIRATLPKIINGITDKDSRVRYTSISCLGEAADRFPKEESLLTAVPSLSTMFRDPDTGLIATVAFQGLSKHHPQDKRIRDAMPAYKAAKGK